MDKNVTNTLSENATLVRLTAKHPSGLKTDKSLRDEFTDSNSMERKTVHLSKHIYGFDVNTYFRKILNQYRNNYYYPLTVAWSDNSKDDDGKQVSAWRLCPNKNLDKLQVSAEKAKIEYFEQVSNFIDNYPDIMNNARIVLADAYKPSDYDDIESIKEKFRFEFELSLVPQFSDDIRLNISKSLRERIESDAIKRATKNIKNIFITTVEALVEQVDHVSSKLKEYDPKNKRKSSFHTSSFDKLREAVDMLPSINSDILGNNKNIQDAHQKLVSVFSKIESVVNLRDDTVSADKKRNEVADDFSSAIGDLKGSFLDKSYGRGRKHD
tara:strand:- start:2250 stop:3224 length:975 start_codon:yes stop_codon:yes gene_type:complete